MQLISDREFLRWAGEREVGGDERYSDTRDLVFRPYRDFKRFWKCPDSPAGTDAFARHLLGALEPWDCCRVWIRGGFWPVLVERWYGADGQVIEDPIPSEYAALLEQAAVPFGERGALHYVATETDRLAALVSAQLQFGWCVDDDVYLLPDHGECLLHVGHHDVVWAKFRSEGFIGRTVRFLAEGGYPLPGEVPDATFRPQPWLGDGDADEHECAAGDEGGD